METKTVTLDAQLLGCAISQTIANGGSFVLTVTGNSMRPTLVPGRDQVCLAAPEVLKPGDIVFFQRPAGEFILHRILRKRNGVYIVNGDSQNWTETVSPRQIIGVVSRICRKGKWHDMDSASMRCYSFLWRGTRAVRPALIRVKAIFH